MSKTAVVVFLSTAYVMLIRRVMNEIRTRATNARDRLIQNAATGDG